MTHFRFENPAMFQWLWMIPVLAVVTYLFIKSYKKKMVRVFSQKIFPFLSSSVSQSKRVWKWVLEGVVITLFIFALARPQSGQSEEKVKSEGIELMLLFDVSRSMLAEDIKPSRLEFAKKEATRLIASGNDKVGIVAFAGNGILLSPLTADKNALNMYIESLTTDTVSSQGTDFKKALQEAEEAFHRGGVETDEKTRVTRAVVVISDGEDNEAGALDAAGELSKKGIKIFSLAVGTEKGGAIPVRDDSGNLRGYRKDKSGKVVLTQTKGTVLRELAKAGGGSFYHLSYGSDVIQSLREDIQKLESAQFDSAFVVDYNENFQIILLFAILLGFIELFLGERRPPGRVWRGRFEVAQR